MQALERRNDPGQDARHAGREALSLALMEARNGTLQWLALLEDAALPAVQASIGTSRAAPGATELSPWRRAGRIAWFQEYWIARHLQRQRGEASDPDATRLASVWPQADALFAPGVAASDTARPDASTLRQFLADTIDTTLELLAGTGDDDASLYFYRLALAHEDRQAEQFAAWAQAHAVALPAPAQAALLRPLVARAARAPLYFPALRWALGSAPGGWVPDRERWAHEVALPEFEIDAQPVSWAQFGEFVEDGGYDDPRHWSAAGWQWLQTTGRRTPRHVLQMRHGVLLTRFGQTLRAPIQQPAVHVSAFEADAWCRWAGRRLPGEAEWEAAALTGASRGFRWGEVGEWTAGHLHPYPGFVRPAPGQPDDHGAAGVALRRVLRGASFATVPRQCHPRRRRAAPPADDRQFSGFRTCAA